MRQNRIFSRSALALLATLTALLAPPAPAQSLQGLVGPMLVPKVEGNGPAAHVTGFAIAPGAAAQRLKSDDIARLGQALIARSGEAQREADLNLGIQVLGDTQGSLGALGTLAQHALWLEQFGDLNNAMSNIGFVMALAQVARDGWNGNDKAALTGGIKAWMNLSSAAGAPGRCRSARSRLRRRHHPARMAIGP